MFNDIAVTGDGSLSNIALRDEIAATLPPDFEAIDDVEFATENQNQLEQGLSFITTFLLVFAAVALVVGTFLILNTFSIIVAQRTRELALFRALGASKAQVTRSVLLEALIVGLVGSTVGLALGFGLAAGLKALFGAIGLDLGAAGLVFEPRTAIAAYTVGVLVTLLAAYLPARKAARVPPVAAMRDDVSIPESSMHRRLLGGVALTVIGAGLMIWALAFDGGLQPLGGGVLAVFIGVALLSPVISRPIVAVIAGGYPRMFGTVGLLAKENARRNPRRTAATASALMIGLALVTTMAILGQSTKSSVDELVSSDLKADYVVSNAVQAPFSAAIAPEIAAVPGVSAAVPFRFGAAEIGGEQTFIAAFDGQAMSQVVSITVDSGALNTESDGVMVVNDRATAQGWQVGDTVTVGLPAGPAELPIVGIIEASPFIGSEIVLPPAALEAGGVVPADSIVYVARTAGADPATVQAGIEGVLADLPTVTVKDQDAFAADQRAPVDQLLGIIYALLGLGDHHCRARHRQHPGAVGDRADPGGRAVACRRHEPTSVAVDDPARVGGHLGARRGARDRVGADLRDQPATGDLRSGHQRAERAARPIADLRRARRGGRGAGGRLAGQTGGEDGRAAGHHRGVVRVQQAIDSPLTDLRSEQEGKSAASRCAC